MVGVAGAIEVDSTSVCGGGTDDTGTDPLLKSLSKTEINLSDFAARVAKLKATQTVNKVALAPGGLQKITLVAPRDNIIDVPSISMGAGATLTLSGTSRSRVILRVAGAVTHWC
jgi:hypothetical protein